MRQSLVMGDPVVTLLACIVLTGSTFAFITIANWPRETLRRPLGETRELAPFERL
jgi:hypothetical protein